MSAFGDLDSVVGVLRGELAGLDLEIRRLRQRECDAVDVMAHARLALELPPAPHLPSEGAIAAIGKIDKWRDAHS